MTAAASGPAPPLRACLAGFEVRSRHRLELAGDRLPAVGRLELELVAELPEGGRWWPLPAADGCRPAAVREDGRRLLAATGPGCREPLSACLRRGLPFAALLQGRGVLHAAALARGREVLALVGASGAGKSTLARRLAARGLSPVSDDLLPCRPVVGGVSVPLPGAGGAAARGRLTALLFVERRRQPEGLALRRLRPRDALVELTRHGWGDLPSPRLWRNQLDLHLALARGVAAFRLHLPDGLHHLPATAGWLAAWWLSARGASRRGVIAGAAGGARGGNPPPAPRAPGRSPELLARHHHAARGEPRHPAPADPCR